MQVLLAALLCAWPLLLGGFSPPVRSYAGLGHVTAFPWLRKPYVKPGHHHHHHHPYRHHHHPHRHHYHHHHQVMTITPANNDQIHSDGASQTPGSVQWHSRHHYQHGDDNNNNNNNNDPCCGPRSWMSRIRHLLSRDCNNDQKNAFAFLPAGDVTTSTMLEQQILQLLKDPNNSRRSCVFPTLANNVVTGYVMYVPLLGRHDCVTQQWGFTESNNGGDRLVPGFAITDAFFNNGRNHDDRRPCLTKTGCSPAGAATTRSPTTMVTQTTVSTTMAASIGGGYNDVTNNGGSGNNDVDTSGGSVNNDEGNNGGSGNRKATPKSPSSNNDVNNNGGGGNNDVDTNSGGGNNDVGNNGGGGNRKATPKSPSGNNDMDNNGEDGNNGGYGNNDVDNNGGDGNNDVDINGGDGNDDDAVDLEATIDRCPRPIEAVDSSMNVLVDYVLDVARAQLRARGLDKLAIPDVNVDVNVGPGHGHLLAERGVCVDMASVRRTPGVDVVIRATPTGINVQLSLGLATLRCSYQHYKLEIAGVRCQGTIEGDVRSNAVDITLDANHTCHVTLTRVQVSHVDDVELHVSGLGALSWLHRPIENWLKNHYREKLVSEVRTHLQQALQAALQSIKCPDIADKQLPLLSNTLYTLH